MMILSIREQVQSMRRTWPSFRILAQLGWYATCEGQIRPLSQLYRIRIALCLGRDLDNVRILPHIPRVTVVDPLLRQRATEPVDPLPHHYPNRSCPEKPILCLYDPAEDEWRFSDAVADTTVPWAIDWLACYEGWLATGEWTGGGRHPGIEDTTRCHTKLRQILRSGPPAR